MAKRFDIKYYKIHALGLVDNRGVAPSEVRHTLRYSLIMNIYIVAGGSAGSVVAM